MGSGKSEVKRYLETSGFPVLDADEVARKLLSADYPEHLLKLKEFFGPEVLDVQGALNRGHVRSSISRSPELRQKFEGWIHPLIRSANRSKIAEWEKAGQKIAFIEGTRLVESGAFRELDGLILVTAPEALRLERLKARGEMSPEEQLALMRTQDEALMREHATQILANDGSLEDLRNQIDKFIGSLDL